MKASERTDGIPTLIIVADDGTRFRCEPAYFSAAEVAPDGDRLRWLVFSRDRRNYIGPAIGSDRSERAIQRTISDWWTSRGRPERTR